MRPGSPPAAAADTAAIDVRDTTTLTRVANKHRRYTVGAESKGSDKKERWPNEPSVEQRMEDAAQRLNELTVTFSRVSWGDTPAFPEFGDVFSHHRAATLRKLQVAAEHYIIDDDGSGEHSRAKLLCETAQELWCEALERMVTWAQSLQVVGDQAATLQHVAEARQRLDAYMYLPDHFHGPSRPQTLRATHEAWFKRIDSLAHELRQVVDSPATDYAATQQLLLLHYAVLGGRVFLSPTLPGTMLHVRENCWLKAAAMMANSAAFQAQYEAGTHAVAAMSLGFVDADGNHIPGFLPRSVPVPSDRGTPRCCGGRKCRCAGHPGISCEGPWSRWRHNLAHKTNNRGMLLFFLASFLAGAGAFGVTWVLVHHQSSTTPWPSDSLTIHDLAVSASIHLGEEVRYTTGGNFTFGPSLPVVDIQCPARFGGPISAGGLHTGSASEAVSISTQLSVAGTARLESGAVISGPTLASHPVSITSTLHVYDAATFGSDANVDGQLTVNGATTLSAGLDVSGAVSADTCTVTGASSTGSMTVARGVVVMGGANVDTLDVSGTAHLASMSVTDSTTTSSLSATTAVLSSVTISQSLSAASIDASEPVHLGSSLGVLGATTVTTLQAKSNVTVAGQLSSGTLAVTGNAALSSVDVTQSLTAHTASMDSVTTGTMAVTTRLDASVLRVTGSTVLGAATATNVTTTTVVAQQVLSSGSVTATTVTTPLPDTDLVLTPLGTGAVVLGPDTQLQLSGRPSVPTNCTAAARGKIYLWTPTNSTAGDQMLVCVRLPGADDVYKLRMLSFA